MLLFPLPITPKLHTQALTDLCSYYYQIAGFKQYVSPNALLMGLRNDYESLLWMRAHVIFCNNRYGIPWMVSKHCAG